MKLRHWQIGAVGGVAVALCGLAVALPLSLLKTGTSDTGPLGNGGSGSLCAPVRTLTLGVDLLSNTSRSPLSVQAFSLIRPRNIKLLGVSLVPLTRGRRYNMIGMVASYPPPLTRIPSDARWSSRRELPATLGPRSKWNLVIGLTDTNGKDGSDAGYQLRYTYEGKDLLWRSRISDRLSANGCS